MATLNCMLIPTAVVTPFTTSNGPEKYFRGVVISTAPELEDAPVWKCGILRATRAQAEADAVEAATNLAAQARRQLRLL